MALVDSFVGRVPVGKEKEGVLNLSDNKKSLASHLAALRKKHAELESRITAMQQELSVCWTRVRAAKAHKLRIKEEIGRILRDVEQRTATSESADVGHQPDCLPTQHELRLVEIRLGCPVDETTEGRRFKVA